MTKTAACAIVAATSLVARPALAEESEEEEHTLIVGVGGASEIELGDGSFHPGVNVMVEWDAVESWLELELGVSVLSSSEGVEVPIDFLIKKPFRLARWAEVMIGVGPEIVHVTSGSERGTYAGAEAALDFMFWPWGRRIGLWAEPEVDVVFHDGAKSGLGATGGLLLGW